MNDKFATQGWPLRRYDFPMPIRYNLTAPLAHGPGVVLCLHGYQDNALSMIRRLGWWEKADLPFQILAINGPFPVPIWSKEGFKEAYSWYFRDTTRELEYLSPMTTAIRLKAFVKDLGLTDVPKVLFGFSQGGFLSPYLASQLKNVRGIIGFGCGYAVDAYEKCQPLRVHAIHGEKDERIPITSSRQEFALVLKAGHHGEFHSIPGLSHKVEASLDLVVRSLALDCFQFGANP